MVMRLVTVALALLVCGCRIQIIVPENGQVQSGSQENTCLAGETCVIEVRDTNFEDVFIAQADAGYSFAGWRREAGEPYLCGGNNDTCTLSSAIAGLHPAFQAVLESDQTFSLQPVFLPEATVCTQMHTTSDLDLQELLSIAGGQGVGLDRCSYYPESGALSNGIAIKALAFMRVSSPGAIFALDDLVMGLNFEQGPDYAFPEDGATVVYLDTDRDAATGEQVGGMGADVRMHYAFGPCGEEGVDGVYQWQNGKWQHNGGEAMFTFWNPTDDDWVDFVAFSNTAPAVLGVTESPLALVRIESCNDSCTSAGLVYGESQLLPLGNYP